MMNKEKTILFVMPRLPFPASSGRKTSLYNYCKILSEELGYRLVVAAFLETDDNPDNKPDFIDRLVILPKANSLKKIFFILNYSLLLKKKPMQVSLYWSNEAKKIIDKLVEDEKPDFVIGDMIRTTEYIKDINTYRIADLDDRISLRYERQLEINAADINPYGAFLKSFPKIIQKIMLIKPLKLFVVKNEIHLLKKYEIEISKICDKTILVAQKEADKINEDLHDNKAISIPIGVDTQYFSYRTSKKNGNLIGFLGAMSVAHNEHAVRYFANDILPLILKEIADAQFLIIGGGASEDLQKLSSSHIKFTGKVDDVRDYMEKCKVFVCPMTFGSGIKTKNLEAMAMGVATVTTNIGAENIDAVSNHDWIIADDKTEFANAVIELLKNDHKRQLIGLNGCKYINENWTWNVAKTAFENLLS